MKSKVLVFVTILLFPIILCAQKFDEKTVREKLEKDFMVTNSFQIFSTITKSVRTIEYQRMEPPYQLADLNLECYIPVPPTSEEQKMYNHLLYDMREEYEYKYHNYINGKPTPDKITGDFNGDGIMEYAWFEQNKFDTTLTIDDAVNNQGAIFFSEKNIKSLVLEWCSHAALRNEGDLNDDGKDEMGVQPNSGSSWCSGYDIYTYKNNEWLNAIEGCCGTAASMRDAGLVLVEKDLNRKGYVIIRRSAEAFEEDNRKMGMPEGFLNHCCCAWCNVVETSVKIK